MILFWQLYCGQIPCISFRHLIWNTFTFQYLAESIQWFSVLINKLESKVEIVPRGIQLKHEITVGNCINALEMLIHTAPVNLSYIADDISRTGVTSECTAL